MTINDLRGALKGRVLLPDDDGFDQAATAWNLTVRQPVAAVVEAADADDVAELVRYARRAGLTVTAQPSGHGASGDVDGLILLRAGALDAVERWRGSVELRAGCPRAFQFIEGVLTQHFRQGHQLTDADGTLAALDLPDRRLAEAEPTLDPVAELLGRLFPVASR